MDFSYSSYEKLISLLKQYNYSITDYNNYKKYEKSFIRGCSCVHGGSKSFFHCGGEFPVPESDPTAWLLPLNRLCGGRGKPLSAAGHTGLQGDCCRPQTL